MAAETLISAARALEMLVQQDVSYGMIDVRAEAEFHKGSLPGFFNFPILSDSERHQVGITYKREGQEKAVRLGYSLVDPVKKFRVDAWEEQIKISSSKEALIFCWRGGMRSEIASQWIRERGFPVYRVEGGYKAIRNLLLKRLENLPEFCVISGLTGCGKTELLENLPKGAQVLDLEKLASHRGSSFGRILGREQPKQATFENMLLLELGKFSGQVIVEDESSYIGSVVLPKPIKEKIAFSPVLWIEADTSVRARRIIQEYVLRPLSLGFSREKVLEHLGASLERLRSKLGYPETDRCLGLLSLAFHSGGGSSWQDPERHLKWVELLLVKYYDPMYRHHFENLNRKVLFRGDWQECLRWMGQVDFGNGTSRMGNSCQSG